MAPLRMAQKTVRTSPPVVHPSPMHPSRRPRATSEAPYHIPNPYEQKMMNIITASAFAKLLDQGGRRDEGEQGGRDR